ncbi:MAG: HigA family addiction module antidote protein [Candidatus Eremiobacteraeota bacterium]|nr:HigA family addiction module antidote protein [Candidatus Eremiobacteraeota bacterium]MBV8671177.1 HigA family addiction module antidote protein [Candidatus Eremiobacteraeota bacterium]
MHRSNASPLHVGRLTLHVRECILIDFHWNVNLSADKLAIFLRVPATRVSEIIHGARKITAETAMRLGVLFKTRPDYWMNLQLSYDMIIAKEELLQ